MAKVYATVRGAEVQIPPYGVATEQSPCVVPAAVGEELSKVEGLRVEPDGEDAATVVPAGTYETREELDVAIKATVETARAKRPKSEKE